MEEKEFKEMQLKTNKFINGRWVAKNSDTEYRLSITDGDCTLEIYKDGNKTETSSFSGRAHWFGPFLSFINGDGKQFYARYADEESLIFGENIGVTFGGNIKWEFKFSRG